MCLASSFFYMYLVSSLIFIVLLILTVFGYFLLISFFVFKKSVVENWKDSFVQRIVNTQTLLTNGSKNIFERYMRKGYA